MIFNEAYNHKLMYISHTKPTLISQPVSKWIERSFGLAVSRSPAVSDEPTQSASELDTKAREHDFYYKYYRVNMRSLIHECAGLDPTPHSVMRRLFTGALQK